MQKQPSRGVHRKMYSENVQKSYRKHPCNLIFLQLSWNHTSACVFSCKFAAYFQNTFPYEHIERVSSGNAVLFVQSKDWWPKDFSTNKKIKQEIIEKNSTASHSQKRNYQYPGKGGGNLPTPSLYLFLNIFISGSKSRHKVFLKRVLAFQLP